MIHTAAFNVNPDGLIETDGDHSPGTSGISWPMLNIECSRISIGRYVLTGSGIHWPEGWRATVYKDENDQNTVWIKLGKDDSGLTIETFDPSDKITPIDIVHLLTLRVACEYSV